MRTTQSRRHCRAPKFSVSAAMRRFAGIERTVRRALAVWERQNGRNGATLAAWEGLAALRDFTVRDVICTNYDTLLEQILPWYDVVFPSHGIETLLSDRPKIVKIHGTATDPKSCVLSLSSYVRAYNVNLHWYLTNVFSTSSVVFMGSSMNPNEPYFRALSLLRHTGRKMKPHYAVVSVRDDTHAKNEGKRLAKFGIGLIPYIPDENHSFIDALVAHINSARGHSNFLRERLKLVQKEIERERFLQALPPLWHLSVAQIENHADRRAVGDVMNEFFSKALQPSTSEQLLKHCEKVGIDIKDLWNRYAELVLPVFKTVTGLSKALDHITRATKRSYPGMARKLDELRKLAAQNAAEKKRSN